MSIAAPSSTTGLPGQAHQQGRKGARRRRRRSAREMRMRGRGKVREALWDRVSRGDA
uniref:Uncharacterized protein n=1 Tax=Oryza sativa subsp. japonica TaxID=39947 RepID=Q6K5W3_ORYSJ|nr:hypothetical protein [Oryza sativa Japonica Group]